MGLREELELPQGQGRTGALAEGPARRTVGRSVGFGVMECSGRRGGRGDLGQGQNKQRPVTFTEVFFPGADSSLS